MATPRPTTVTGLETAGSCTLRAYEISVEPGPVDPALRAAAMPLIRGFADELPGRVGFVIYHRARPAHFVLAHLWDGVDLVQRYWTSPLDDPAALRPHRDGAIGCIWELAVVARERDAWAQVCERPDAEAAYLRSTPGSTPPTAPRRDASPPRAATRPPRPVPTIRPATPDDIPNLPAIEAAAGEAFRGIGMPEVADDPLPGTSELAAHARDGRVWVAQDGDRVVAYALAVLRDGSAHLEQVSVHPGHAGRRIGEALVDVVARWAADRGDTHLTLTTFADVPWNAPYYRRLGFHPLPGDALGPQLAAELTEERRRFAAPRLVMTRPSRAATDHP